MRGLILFLATGAYLGYAPVASGTFGSLAALPLIFVFATLTPAVQFLALGVFIGVACWLAGAAEGYLGEHDSGKIVIDEVAGFLCATAWLDLTPTRLLLAFALFRLFDILKPPPARYFDRQVTGGLGVVFDDVVAGLYANLALRLLIVGNVISS